MRNAPAQAVKQLDIQFLFQLAQAVRQRGLCDKQVLRRQRQVFGLRDVQKVAELAYFHG
jgi:hypothetical protein